MSDRPLPQILEKIRATKEVEVSLLLQDYTEVELHLQALKSCQSDPPRDFFQAVTRKPAGGINLIAEIKKASPSKGVIREDFDPVAIAQAYDAGGAAALSCLTDSKYFLGCGEYLTQVRKVVTLPVLRKDFLIHPAQLDEARILGADAVLLIARMLTREELEKLLALAEKLGMAALTEVHDGEDIAKATDAGAGLIGINNRDLDTFVVDTAATPRLRKLISPEIPVVAESGIFTHEDMKKLAEENICAALVGESLMREPNVEAATCKLLGK